MDFYASWCGPCKALAPILEGLAEKYGEKVKVVKVDVDEETSIAEKFGIANIPTVIFFKGGNTAAAFVGYRKEREIEKIIENYCKRKKLLQNCCKCVADFRGFL